LSISPAGRGFAAGPRAESRLVLGLSLYIPPERCNKSFSLQSDSMARSRDSRPGRPCYHIGRKSYTFVTSTPFGWNVKAESEDSARGKCSSCDDKVVISLCRGTQPGPGSESPSRTGRQLCTPGCRRAPAPGPESRRLICQCALACHGLGSFAGHARALRPGPGPGGRPGCTQGSVASYGCRPAAGVRRSHILESACMPRTRTRRDDAQPEWRPCPGPASGPRPPGPARPGARARALCTQGSPASRGRIGLSAAC
jgi:hypothetical protein